VEDLRGAGSLQVWRCPLWVPAQPGGVKRLLHLASFALTSIPVMLRHIFWRPDLVWVVEPALFCAPTALVVARLSGAKAWLHVQDFEVDAAFDLGLLRGKRLRSRVAGAERWLMRRFDVVSTISQRMHQRLLSKGVAPSKAVLAPNWVDMAQFALPSADGVAAYRRELGIADGAVVALYSGNMGGKQGLEVLADVARLCSELVFVFCGNGAGRSDLVARCAGLTNVRFLDLQPAKQLPDLLATASIHLLPQRADAADLVMPSKLTGMLASARPVVATAKPGTELANVVQSCGLVVPPEDPAAFAQALMALAADPVRCERLGNAGFLYAQAHLDKNSVLTKFEADLQALVMTGTVTADHARHEATR
jgi:colanic acid biosynthesis glycosyl transferase WcaI